MNVDAISGASLQMPSDGDASDVMSGTASGKVVDHKTEVPLEHYCQQFAARNPQDMAARSGITYDANTQSFSLCVLGRSLRVEWPSMEGFYIDSQDTLQGEPQAISPKLRILLGRLIMEGQLVQSTGKFIPYQSVPWGDVYLKPFTGRCITRLAHMFCGHEDFVAACQALGGTKAADGDASFDFEFVDKVIVRLIVWDADEEFSASAQILFSDNTPLAFTAEDLAQLCDILLDKLHALR